METIKYYDKTSGKTYNFVKWKNHFAQKPENARYIKCAECEARKVCSRYYHFRGFLCNALVTWLDIYGIRIPKGCVRDGVFKLEKESFWQRLRKLLFKSKN